MVHAASTLNVALDVSLVWVLGNTSYIPEYSLEPSPWRFSSVVTTFFVNRISAAGCTTVGRYHGRQAEIQAEVTRMFRYYSRGLRKNTVHKTGTYKTIHGFSLTLKLRCLGRPSVKILSQFLLNSYYANLN